MTKTYQILVVEDEHDIAFLLRMVLEQAGYRVLYASNGLGAIDILSRHPNTDLIFLDLMMPVMNGFEFLEYKSKDPVISSIPVILSTAFVDEAKKLRVNGIMKKPYEIESIIYNVEKFCKNAQAS